MGGHERSASGKISNTWRAIVTAIQPQIRPHGLTSAHEPRGGVKSQYPCLGMAPVPMRHLQRSSSVCRRGWPGPELLPLVVTGSVGPQQQPVLGDLNGVVDHADPDDLSGVAVADAVTGPREAHRSPRVDPAQDLASGRGP